MSALKYKIFRSHFVTLVLKRATWSMQNLPAPEGYGWEREGETLIPIMTDNLPAPLATIELSVCGCKSDCSTNRCRCAKHDLPCTDMCKCNECLNTGDKDEEIELESDDDEYDN